jgi:hypothetical protein
MKKQFLFIAAAIVMIIFGYLMYVKNNPNVSLIPPEIQVKDAFYASSTNEMVIIWSIENIQYFPINNTGIRYDSVSHATTTPTSLTYEKVKLPPELNSDGNFEIRIDFEDAEELFFRVQAKLDTEGFLWSNEQSVKKINLDPKIIEEEE